MFKKILNKLKSIMDTEFVNAVGQEAPKHIVYYDYVFKLKTDTNALIKLEKVINTSVSDVYDLHLMNLSNKQMYVIKSTDMHNMFNISHSGRATFGNIMNKDGLDNQQLLLSTGLNIPVKTNEQQNQSLTPTQSSGTQIPNVTTIPSMSDAQILGYDAPSLTPMPQKGIFKYKPTIERVKKETEIIPLKFDNIPNKNFIKMFVDNLDMDEKEIKEFNKELADYVFDTNKKAIMESIKEYYQMEKEVKRGRPSGAKSKRKKEATFVSLQSVSETVKSPEIDLYPTSIETTKETLNN